MFEAAVTKFAKAFGDDVLIPVPNLVDAKKCEVLKVVIKKNRRWFWQSPKYYPSGFKLEEILVERGLSEDSVKTDQLVPSYEKTNKLSVSGKLGLKLKGLLEVEVNGSDSIDLETKFGKILQQEILRNDMLKLIDGRHIDMKHQLLEETLVNPRKVVCCVGRCVRLADGGSIKTGLEIIAEEKVDKGTVVDEDTKFDDSISRSMELMSGTVLAYSLFELKVNVKDGSFKALGKDGKGGFTGEDEADSGDLIDDSEEKDYGAIVSLEPSERDQLRTAVLGLCNYDEDVDVMLVTIKEACKGITSKITTMTNLQAIAQKFQCEEQYWQFLLKFGGFTFNDGSISYPRESSQQLASLRCLFEALIELDEDTLKYFVQLNQELVKPLLYLLKNGIDGKSQSVTDSDISLVYTNSNPAQSLSEELGFSNVNGTVAPPDVRNMAAIHGAMRAAYALWWDANEAPVSEGSACVLL